MGRGSGHGFATWLVQCSRESSNAKVLGHLNRLCQGLSDVPSGGHLYARLVEITRESCPVEPLQRV